MRQLGLPVSPALMAVGNFTAESGARAAKEVLDGGEPFTAICCASDETAVGAMQTLRNHGLKVPNDVSIVGFDDIPLSQYLDPPLTTVRQPTDRLGFEAVSILLEQLRNPKFEPRMLVLPTEMMVRGSTAPPRN
jgi:DNA-binding LacI/PurR family transcriptional regulator